MDAKPNTSAERRRTPRYRVTFRIVCNDGRSFSGGTVLDLSMGGILFRSEMALEMNSEISLVPLGEAGELLFDISGVVVRCSPAKDRPDRFNLGVRFVGVDDATRFSLMKLMQLMPETPDHPDPKDTLFPFPEDDAQRSRPHMRMRARRGAASDKTRWRETVK